MDITFLKGLITIAALYLVFIVFNYLSYYTLKIFLNKKGVKDKDYVKRVHFPIFILLWILAIFFTLERFVLFFHYEHLTEYIINVRNALIIISSGWFLIRFWELYETLHSTIDNKPMMQALRKIVHGVIIFIVIMMCLEVFKVGLGSLLTIGGVSGIAVSLAARDALANFFGGLIVYFTQIFNLGDIIVLKEKSIEGTVVNIGWYITQIRTEDEELVYIPNSLFCGSVLINKSRSKEWKKWI